MSNKFPISRFLGGKVTFKEDNAIKRFLGLQHEFQCKKILGSKYEEVHKEIDAKRGRNHRRYGHNVEFIKQKFKGKKKSAAYIHLLGDYILDILPDVLDYVLKNIQKDKIKPPCYLYPNKNQSSWDIQEKAKEVMIEKCGKIYIDILKNKKNRKVSIR